jgi:hypothetical protein
MSTNQEYLTQLKEYIGDKRYVAAYDIAKKIPNDPWVQKNIKQLDLARRLEEAAKLRKQTKYQEAIKLLHPVREDPRAKELLTALEADVKKGSTTPKPRTPDVREELYSTNDKRGFTEVSTAEKSNAWTWNQRALAYVQSIPPFPYALALSAIWTGMIAVLVLRPIPDDTLTYFGQARLLSLSINFTIVVWILTGIRYAVRDQAAEQNSAGGTRLDAFGRSLGFRLKVGFIFGLLAVGWQFLSSINHYALNETTILEPYVSFFWVFTFLAFLLGFFLHELLPVIFFGSLGGLILMLVGVL